MRAIALAVAALLSSAAFAKLKVITTVPSLASIVKAIGGSDVSVSSLVVGARDPHRLEAKPSYMSRVAGADLFVAIGLELEVAWEPAILQGSGNSKVGIGQRGHVYASNWASILDKPKGHVTRAQGDIHPYGNPHIMLDPYNGRQVAVGLAAKMGELDPKSKEAYRENMRKFVNRLDAEMFGQALFAKYGGPKLWDWQRAGELVEKLKAEGTLGQLGGWAGTMLPFSGKPIIAYHRSLTYLAARFGLRVLDELEPKPGIDPTPGHLAEVIRTGQASGVRAIVQEPFYSTRSSELVARRIGATVVVIPTDVGHQAGVGDYLALFDSIVSKLASGMR